MPGLASVDLDLVWQVWTWVHARFGSLGLGPHSPGGSGLLMQRLPLAEASCGSGAVKPDIQLQPAWPRLVC